MAWLAGWTARKSHSLTGSVGAETNYQIKVVVHSGAGSDDGEDVYLRSYCTDFPNDIRFTDDDGETELDHFCENLAADPATFWVEVKDDLDSNQSILIYCGKSGAATASDGDATWEDYDQFDNLDDWAASPTKTIMHTDDTHVLHGTYAAMKDESDSDTIEKDYGSVLTGRRVRWWFYDDGETDTPYADVCGFFDDTPDFCVIGRRDLTSTTHYMYRIAGVWTATAVARSTGWHLAEFLIWATDDIDGYIGDTKIFDSANINGMQKPAAGCWWGQNGDYWVDAFCVGKLANPEPTHGAWGGLELDLSLTDGLALGDTPTGTLTIPTSLTDGLTVGDTPTPNVIFQVALTDGLVFSDWAEAIRMRLRTIQDFVGRVVQTFTGRDVQDFSARDVEDFSGRDVEDFEGRDIKP